VAAHVDPREWISFEDPDYERTWMVDATFLRSAWTCIWGRGCKGTEDTDATARNHGCCSDGAHFIDAADLRGVRAAVKRLGPATWERHRDGRGGRWLVRRTGTDGGREWATAVRGGVCIFFNSRDFPGGEGCALHLGALAARRRPLDWKPDVCWQLPLRLEEHTEGGHVVATLREWKRRDWDEAGSDFHWWCTDAPDAFVGRVPVYEALRDELRELVGDRVHAILQRLLAAPATTRLPHPAVRLARVTRGRSSGA
jgi:hypothetical protein